MGTDGGNSESGAMGSAGRGTAALGTAGGIEEIAAPGRRHYPALDGLRGLAILLVLFCHYAFILPVRTRLGASLEILSFQGWMGVTLFFCAVGLFNHRNSL